MTFSLFYVLCTAKKTKQDHRFFVHPVEVIEQEILEMKIKSETSFLCLSLLVLKNDICCKDDLRSLDVKQLVNDICRDTMIETVVSMVSMQKYFERLKGIYIIEAGNIYTAIHDKMFDIISAAIAPYIMKCLIKHADIRFLKNRIQLLSLGRSGLPFVIYIPPELERIYFKRQYKEAMKGKYWEVFGNIQTENKTYRKLLLSFLKEQDRCQHIYYVPGKDRATPLFVSASLGYIDFVQYFIVNFQNVHTKDKKGRSAFFVACENGHIAVVQHLIKYHKDVNKKNAAKTTVLSATCGHIDVAQLLLDNKADIGITDKLNQNSFHFACLNGNAQLVRLLLSAYNVDITIRNTDEHTDLRTAHLKGLSKTNKQNKKFCRDVNHKNNVGCTPLHLACEKSHFETVKLLLELNVKTKNRCVDTDTINEHGFSILHSACYNGHTEIVKLLIDAGVNVNDTTMEGAIPLSLACQQGHYDTVKYLLHFSRQASKTVVDRTTNHKDEWPALHVACLNGHIEVVTLLIDSGFNINDTTNKGFTPLYLACRNGHYDTVKFLLNLNRRTLNNYVDTKIKDKNGWSVIHAACFEGHTPVVKLLIELGMNINDTSNRGYTPLCVACEGCHLDTVKYLLDLNGQTLKSRVDTATRDENGWSVLHRACYSGHTHIVKLLIDAGINVNETATEGYSPLFLACNEGHYDTEKLLLDLNGQALNSRVDTTTRDENGWSVLHRACYSGHTHIVKLLIDAGINVNETATEGYSPLFLACNEGHYDTEKLLLDLNGQALNSRVDTTIKDTDGQSALHAAYSNGHTKVVKLMTDFGINDRKTRNRKYSCVIL